MLALAGVSPDYPMQVDGRTYKVADLIEAEKLSCRAGIELTFKLIALSYYLRDDLDQTWRNHSGEVWSISRLIDEELSKPILRNAACGGTHRMMGFSYAVHFRQRSGKPMTGDFYRAYVNDYIRHTFGQQNQDGSFSTEWFRQRAASPSLDRRLQTTGHILEWLVFSIPDELLTEAPVVNAVTYLNDLMAQYPQRNWEIGPMGHAIHALALYDKRMTRMETRVSPLPPSAVSVEPPAPTPPASVPSSTLRLENLPAAELEIVYPETDAPPIPGLR